MSEPCHDHARGIFVQSCPACAAEEPCPVTYQGPSYPRFHGLRCVGARGHADNLKNVPLAHAQTYRHAAFTHENSWPSPWPLTWCTPEEKVLLDQKKIDEAGGLVRFVAGEVIEKQIEDAAAKSALNQGEVEVIEFEVDDQGRIL